MDLFLASALQNTADFFIKGGVFMLLILLASILSGTVIIVRAIALREKSVIPKALVAEIDRLQPGDNLDTLQELVKKDDSALAHILKTLLSHLSWPKAETVEAVQTKARHEVAHLESGLVILEILTGLGPLLGLLGTLSGLIGIFSNLGSGGDPVFVARGISEALNTTIMGLGLSVPSLIFYNYFQRRIEMMSVEMESLIADLLAKCYPQGAAPVLQKLS